MEEENAARRAIRMRLKDPENYAIYRADRIKRAERMENEMEIDQSWYSFINSANINIGF